MPAQQIFEQFIGASPWVVITAVATWVGKGLIYRQEIHRNDLDHDVQIETHRDELTFQLLSSARNEVIAARSEMEGLREEVRTLRSLEQHFYHFQQSLEHLEAILHAKDGDERQLAERNAKAFLTRMRRLQDAKGAIANEAQRLDAQLSMKERVVRDEGGQV